jgi:hypothetical protein
MTDCYSFCTGSHCFTALEVLMPPKKNMGDLVAEAEEDLVNVVVGRRWSRV